MPLLTFPLFLVLVACAVGGAVVTWLLQERRHRREQLDLERHMTRELEARYEVYEGLEKSVVQILARFDGLQQEFRRKVDEARHPRAALEQTVRLRSSNPELWDLEREHHQVQCEQLSELSRQSARIAELMHELEGLEPGKREVEAELERLRSRHQVAVANFHEAEKAAGAKIQRLETAVRELDTLRARHEQASRELAALRKSADEAAKAHDQQIRALAPQAERSAKSEARAADLEQVAQKREQEALGHARRATALDADLAAARKLLEASEAKVKALEDERAKLVEDIKALRAKLEVTRASHEALQREYERVRTELEHASARTKGQQQSLAEALTAADGLRGELAKSKELAAERDRRADELEQAYAKLSTAHDQLRIKAEDDLVDARNELHMARSDGEALQLRLAEADSRCAALQSHAQAEKARFEREIAGLRADFEGRWAKEKEVLAGLKGSLAGTSDDAGKLRSRAADLEVQLSKLQSSAQQERSSLEAAVRGLQAENAAFRARLENRKGTVEEAWSLLHELKPMLETLERKLKVTEEPPPALPAPNGARPGHERQGTENGLDIFAVDEKPATSS
jgi:chromosome segregation ATPase